MSLPVVTWANDIIFTAVSKIGRPKPKCNAKYLIHIESHWNAKLSLPLPNSSLTHTQAPKANHNHN